MLWHYIKSEGIIGKTVFNTYLSVGRSNQKVEESGLAFFGQIGLAVTFPTQIQIHKYTNTQIHKYSILQIHTYLSFGRSNQKVEESGLAFFLAKLV